MRKLKCLAVLALVALGCSNPAGVVKDLQDSESGDLVNQELVVPDQKSQAALDLEAEELPLGPFDTVADFSEPGCAEGEGCFLDPCAENGQCQSGWCVEHLGDGVCTQSCQDECPPGWTCKQVAGTDPDLVFVCASHHANLCKPCRDGNDCLSPSGVADVCVSYGDEGSFCGGACAQDDDCPWGFSCVDGETVDGIETTQCKADAGVCPCTEKSVALGLWTSCGVDNEFGQCEGKRVCGETGLSACDAATPAEEVCNGLDDDCDGTVDEPQESGGTILPLCDDGNDCTEDTCLGAQGCDHVPLDGVECKDGDICTVADHCVAGECIGDPVICDDENPCTDNICTETGGCEYVPNLADCDDGDPCTVADECHDSVCEGTPISCTCKNDADCGALEDGDLCNGTLFCDKSTLPFTCAVNLDTVVDCPAPEGVDAICLTPTCDPLTGACGVAATHEGMACEEGNPCTIGDTCQAGKCTGGAPLNCNDGNLCTDDSCDPAAGCVHADNDDPCDDGDLCTLGDTCGAGICQAGQGTLACDDGNPCTADSCVTGVGCLHSAIAGECDDNDACTLGDTCINGKCVFVSLADCDDANPCTDDVCVPGAGCQHKTNQAVCDDGNPCTPGDVCANGQCQGTGALLCDDGNPCTDDSCSPEAGCLFVANQAPCDDGNACTLEDGCGGGLCLPGAAAQCSDGDVCTDDVCQPESGCLYLLNKAPCNDGNLCTTNDACHLGECLGGGELNCDDGSDCTADSCNPDVGCQFKVIVTPCCTGGTEACGELCVNKLTDPSHCGDCNAPCDSGEVCVGGICQTTCGAEQEQCGDICTDTSFDPDHCSECFHVCESADNASAICVSSECAQLCHPGYADCNLDMVADGCEIHLPTDPDHCGACAKACAAVDHGTRGCTDGSCIIDGCDGAWKDCDGIVNNGCESDSLADPQNCGVCGNVCGQGFVCKDGDCIEQPTNFIVLAEKDITYVGIDYKLLKVGLASNQSLSDNWCYEYRNLCESYGLAPTGCGLNWNSTYYKVCRDTYGSVTYDNSLSCNPSGQISAAAKANGFGDATASNSFGFHYCNNDCSKTLCSSTNCQGALSYIDASKSHGYTLCIK